MIPSAKNKHMMKVVDSLASMIDLLYGAGCFLTAIQLAKLAECLDKLGRHYQRLSMDAFEADMTLWQTVPDFHYILCHLHAQASLINPTWVQ